MKRIGRTIDHIKARQHRGNRGQRYRLFCVVDDLVLESVLLGAVGWVAGLVNTFPEETRLLWDLASAGRPISNGHCTIAFTTTNFAGTAITISTSERLFSSKPIPPNIYLLLLDVLSAGQSMTDAMGKCFVERHVDYPTECLLISLAFAAI